MALGDGITWDESVPIDATEAIYIDDHMRHLYTAVRSRMALEHEFPSSQAATAEGGKHKFITMQTQGVKPTLSGTQLGAVYCKSAGAAEQVLFFEDSAGNENAISPRLSIYLSTTGGSSTSTSDWVQILGLSTSFTVLVASRPTQFIFSGCCEDSSGLNLGDFGIEIDSTVVANVAVGYVNNMRCPIVVNYLDKTMAIGTHDVRAVFKGITGNAVVRSDNTNSLFIAEL